jgi:DNA-binding NtrC family response regulator
MQSRLDALIATPDDDARRVLLELLDRCGWLATEAVDPAATEQRLERQFFDLVVVSAAWTRPSERALVERLRELSPASSLVLLGGSEDVPMVASLSDVTGYLATPIDPTAARTLFESLAHVRADHARDRRRDEILDADVFLVGKGPAMSAVVRELELVARTDAPVLLTGEHGLGQAGIARRIHEKSRRAHMPFVVIDCDSLPDELLDEELFGRDPGDGATRAPSAVERAHRGTLFLDSLASASPTVQRKLVRLFEGGVIHPAATARRIKVDVRVVVAATPSLPAQVASGVVLADLYYRLSSMEIALPSLRERRSDLREIVDAVLTRLRGPQGQRKLSADAWFALSHHDFPDNVREVISALTRAVILAQDGEIGLQHLPPNLRGDRGQGRTEEARPNAVAAVGQLDPAARDFERDFLVRALAAAGGNRTRAAQLLGLSRKGLWQKLRAHDIPASEGRGAREPAPVSSKPEATGDGGVIRGPWSKSGGSD